MKLSEQAEEILEALWIVNEEKDRNISILKDLNFKKNELVIKELVKNGIIKIDNRQIILEEKGKKEAESAIRRHRLAERLMTDVFDIKQDLMNKRACQFEHMLRKDMEERVCTLLGHPKVCPHNKPIPPGKCCLKKIYTFQSAVLPLSELKTGQKGKIAYLYTKDNQKLQKLMVMGVLPGMDISLIQKFPAYVFQVGLTQVAIDQEIAKEIFVRLSG